MALKRLPTPNSDAGNWGVILNEFLQQISPTPKGGLNIWTTSTRPSLGVDDEGKTGINTDINGIERWNGTAWVTVLSNNFLEGRNVDSSASSNVTLTTISSKRTQHFRGSLTSNRVITLSNTGAIEGDFFRIRTFGLTLGPNTFTVTASNGALNTSPFGLSANSEYRFEFDGSSWYYAYI